MKKILKPKNTFLTKPHSLGPTFLSTLQNQIFSNSKLIKEQKIVEILSSETRFQILALLSLRTNICVGDIADVLRLQQSAVSHQLRWLRKESLVDKRKKGRVVYYKLADQLPKIVEMIVGQG